MNWIKVTDRLPESDMNVLAVSGGKVKVMALCQIDDDEENTGLIWGQVYDSLDGEAYVDDAYEVTHWMPLPPTPQQ